MSNRILINPKQWIRLAIAGLFGFSLAALLWMLMLPAGFISKRGLAISILAGFVLMFVFYKLLIPYFEKTYQSFKFLWGFLAIFAVLISGMAYQLVIVNSSLIFPFLPKQKLEVTLQSDSIAFRPIECELTTIYSNKLESSGHLIRVNSSLMTISGSGTKFTWTGWTGSRCLFTLVAPDPNTTVDISWNGNSTHIETPHPVDEDYPTEFSFNTPSSTKWIVGGIVSFVVVGLLLILVDGIMFLFGAQKITENSPALIVLSRGWNLSLNIPLFVLIALLFLRFLYNINPFTYFPTTDSGVFLYIGKGILSGGTPYLDFWDHKGPLIYFINALGLAMNPAGEWGIFGIQVVFLAMIIFFIYRILTRYTNFIVIGFGLCVYLYFLPIFAQGGNLVEFYALLFYIIGLDAGLQAIETGKKWPLFILGMTAALSFCLRPNLVSVFIILIGWWLILSIKHKTGFVQGALLFASGAAVIIGPILLFFITRHALSDLIDQLFIYNYLYSGNTGSDFWTKLTAYSRFTLPLVLAGIMGSIFVFGINSKSSNVYRKGVILPVLVLSFLLELVLSRISGYDFEHYSMPLQLIVILILVFFFDSLVRQISWTIQKKRFRLAALSLTLVPILGFSSYMLLTILNFDYSPRKLSPSRESISQWIDQRPTLLIWGAESDLNLLYNIPSPTRYTYQYPLFNERYCTKNRGDEFLRDIETKLPVILDAAKSNSWTPSLEVKNSKVEINNSVVFGPLTCLQPFFNFFDTHYVKVFTIPDNRWDVYLPIESIQPPK